MITQSLASPTEVNTLKTKSLVANVQADGDVTCLVGIGGNEVIAWEDLRFPAQGINPAGVIADPVLDTTETGFPGTLLFSGTVDNMIAINAQMPHAWKPETAIVPHIHWSKPTGSANAVVWEMYYRSIGNVGSTAGAWQGPVTGTLTAGTQTTSDNHLLTSFGSISTTGARESAMYAFRVYRRGSTDAESNQVRLYEFDIHYQKEKSGTYLQLPGA